LHHQPVRDPGLTPGVAMLEGAFSTILDECTGLSESDLLHYLVPSMGAAWSVYLFCHMGIEMESIWGRCPRTFELLKSLPRVCFEYPWGDTAFSFHDGPSHLTPHCSIDNLRVRCHLGIQIPEGCEIRVETQRLSWQEGKALLFEDCFEHEVWNRSHQRRAILIVDFWHPDLTDAEIKALTAGFRKPEVRRLFAFERLRSAGNTPPGFMDWVNSAIDKQGLEAPLEEYWVRSRIQVPE
jgi:hypothetical protein